MATVTTLSNNPRRGCRIEPKTDPSIVTIKTKIPKDPGTAICTSNSTQFIRMTTMPVYQVTAVIMPANTVANRPKQGCRDKIECPGNKVIGQNSNCVSASKVVDKMTPNTDGPQAVKRPPGFKIAL